MNALDQAWGVLKESPFADRTNEVLANMIKNTPPNHPLHEELMMEAGQRMRDGTGQGRADMLAQLERAMNETRVMSDEAPAVVAPPAFVAEKEIDFPPNFDREKLASADAFTSAWDVVKAVLPDLAFNTELERFKGFNPYERDALTYQLSIDPEDARSILDSQFGYVRDEDYFKYPTQMAAWNRELGKNPTLFQYPQHIMSRLSGRHSRDQKMSMEDFRNFALDTDIMTNYVDEMERRASDQMAIEDNIELGME